MIKHQYPNQMAMVELGNDLEIMSFHVFTNPLIEQQIFSKNLIYKKQIITYILHLKGGKISDAPGYYIYEGTLTVESSDSNIVTEKLEGTVRSATEAEIYCYKLGFVETAKVVAELSRKLSLELKETEQTS